MALQNQRLKRRLLRVLPILAALVVLLVSLVLVSDVQRDDSAANRTYLWVLVLTLLALAVLLLSIVSRVASLLRKVRREEPGARLAARWVRNFLVFSLPPALIVYLFSIHFLTRTIDNWFDVDVERALQDSLALGQAFLDQRTLEARNQSQRLADRAPIREGRDQIRAWLLGNVAATGPRELTVLTGSGAAVATAAWDPLDAGAVRPEAYALLQGLERGEYAAAEPSPSGGLLVRVLQRLPDPAPGQEYLLQAVYPLPDNLTALTSNIEAEYYRYRNVAYLRDSLKQSFLLILTLVLLLTVLLAILAALSTARRMVTPLSDLAVATRRVAEGDLAQAVETNTQDEVGFLSESFNEMSQALVRASDAAERGRARLQAQGDYLETVLGSLSAGVLSLDPAGTLVRVNPAAEAILGLPRNLARGQSLDELAGSFPFLLPLSRSIGRHVERGHEDWQEELRLERDAVGDRSLVLLARGSALPASEYLAGGHVVVFDDVTVLNQAQRDAAWGEVARQLAHEVKNPLTPIRLAAERMRMKLTDRLSRPDADMLDRSTSTIVAQVEALRRLVDAFGDYAREPDLERGPLALDRLVREVCHLYRESDPDLDLSVDLCPGPPGLEADEGRLRQLLHNLLGNARDAMAGTDRRRLSLRTRVESREGRDWLVLDVEDSGPGFPREVLEQPFEPYVSHKPDGSGLGLAICRRIVTDHDGTIGIENLEEGGARARICLPLKRRERRPEAVPRSRGA